VRPQEKKIMDHFKYYCKSKMKIKDRYRYLAKMDIIYDFDKIKFSEM
jgi:hypothetical protein